MNARVVITGIGIISPYGVGEEVFYKALKEGTSCIKKISLFDVSSFKSQKGGLITNFLPEEFDNDERFCRLPRIAQYSIVAADLVMKDIQDAFDSTKIGIFLGTDHGAIEFTERFYSNLIEKGPERVNPLLFQETVFNAPASHISLKYKIKGPTIVITSGYVSGLLSVMQGVDYLQRGKLDLAIVGGIEELTKTVYEVEYHLGILSPQDEGEEECRPFDAKRNGFIPSEGAGILLIERLDQARKRKAHIYGEIIGWGNSSDSYKIADYSPEGEGIKNAMLKALREANLNPEKIDYIAAAANGSRVLDRAETKAIKDVFGNYAYKIALSSIKSIVGESSAPSGVFNLIAVLFSMENNLIPPTINYENYDPECDLYYVPNIPKRMEVKTGLANAISFGGNSCSIIVQKL
ncbi:MAG: beta-ketoacyl-[acyl-carrier-protein] synthase family protein [bacterium]